RTKYENGLRKAPLDEPRRRRRQEGPMKLRIQPIFAAVVGAIALTASCPAFAHDMGGMEMNSADGADTGATGGMGKHMVMSDHMTMTPSRAGTPQDLERAQMILSTMRSELAKYQDDKLAQTDGYQPYLPTVPQDVYHFANREFAANEYMGDVDIKHPGALLYEKTLLGHYKLVGAMYSAPADYTADRLNGIIPLSIGHWHAHTNICLPAGMTEQDVLNGQLQVHGHPMMPSSTGMRVSAGTRMRLGYLADPRFGFAGTI